jgi:ferritin-like metal-binding protein YciE
MFNTKVDGMKELKNLRDLLVHEVQGLYNTEKLQVIALERMMNKTSSNELKAVLEQHLQETKIQKQRLEQLATQIDIDPDDEGSPSIKGLMFEGEKLLHKDATPETLDAAITAAVQKVEHLEMACYGTAAFLAEELGLQEACDLLRQSLAEEKKTDEMLNELAKTTLNKKAEQVES